VERTVLLSSMMLQMPNHLTMSSNGCMRLIGESILWNILLTYLMNDHDTFSYASENVNKLLVGNKSDLASKRAVSFEQGQVLKAHY